MLWKTLALNAWVTCGIMVFSKSQCSLEKTFSKNCPVDNSSPTRHGLSTTYPTCQGNETLQCKDQETANLAKREQEILPKFLFVELNFISLHRFYSIFQLSSIGPNVIAHAANGFALQGQPTSAFKEPRLLFKLSLNKNIILCATYLPTRHCPQVIPYLWDTLVLRAMRLCPISLSKTSMQIRLQFQPCCVCCC